MTEPQSEDAALRTLERAARESPTDGGARLRLARAHVRLGQRRDALAALDLPTLPWERFAEARALADELWEAELASLECVASLAIDDFNLWWDREGRFVAWVQDSGELGIQDVVAARPVAPTPPIQARVITFSDSRLFLQHPSGGRVEELALDGGARTVAAGRLPSGLDLRGVSRQGDRLHVWHRDTPEDPGFSRILAWPSLEPVGDDLPAVVDLFWDARHVVFLGRDDAGRYATLARPVDGGPSRTLSAAQWTHCELGPAVVKPGLRLIDLAAGRDVTVVPRDDREWAPPFGSVSLSSDRRGVRFSREGRVARIDVDLAAGTVLTPPEEAARRADPLPAASAVARGWHPHADVFAETRALKTLDGRTLRSFPSTSQTMGWSREGDSLYVRTRTQAGFRSEIWRAPGSLATKRSA